MFQTHQVDNLIYLTSDVLGSGVRHGFSTRKGGVSTGPLESLNLRGYIHGDKKENVEENYRRFCAVIGVDVQKVVLSQQEHQDHLRLVTAADCGKGLWRERDYRAVDGLLCNTPGIPLVVFSADCNVILLHDPVHHAIAAVHAGWRGTALGIAAKAVREMHTQFGSDPTDIRAAIGPAIGKCCFETDDDVPCALRAALGEAAEPYMTQNGVKWHIDLKGINALWLQREGLTHIDTSDLCTMCRTDLFWSHRKLGNTRGVQAAVICLED